jgi:hypothetical protein
MQISKSSYSGKKSIFYCLLKFFTHTQKNIYWIKFDQLNLILAMQINGKILAPHRDAWGSCSKRWLYFLNVHGMTVDGSGVIDGQGEAWWGNVRNNIHIFFYTQI